MAEATRTIPPVNGESGARDLSIAVGVIIALSRFAPDGFVWPIAIVLLAGVILASLQVLGEADPAGQGAGVAVEGLLLPGASALAALGAIRLVPIGVVLAPAFVLAGGLIGLTLVTELRIARASGPPSSADRTAVLIEVLLVGFFGFAGVAVLVPGGLPALELAGISPSKALDVIAQAAADGLIALLLGYRVAALRSSNVRDVAWFGITGAAVVAIAAVALRSIEIPRILGPALLVLVFFLWDAIHVGTPSRRRDPWRRWETIALAALAVVVIGWSLGIRA
ncbi:MAG: hypothetical protein QOI92_1404 [Chloroflexota bacterium]|jgi:hypothetical protein|nr:hypothetical protein [Chloroflexota bacterium]